MSEYVKSADLLSVKTELIERMDAQQIRLLERLEHVEMTLLKEFRKWALIG